MRELKISTSWVRGVVGDALTPELAVNFACAFGAWAEGGPVAIGRDTRQSSPMLRAAVAAGLMSSGCEVLDLGICTTPLLSFAVREWACAGGIAVTGSHNDARWNALKFIGPDGGLLNAVKGEELLDIYHASAFRQMQPGRFIRAVEARRPVERYLECLLAGLDGPLIRSRRYRAAIDFCCGACAGVTAEFLAALGCTLVPLNPEPSGRFPHSPAPTAESMAAVGRAAAESGADLGAAFNIDGDRIAFVLPDGRPLSEEHSLPLAALSRLTRRPGLIVTNLSTSRMVDAVAARRGERVVRAPVGESHVIERGLEEGAVLAGEGSGGVVFLPAGMTFDALPTLGAILETMAATGATLTEMAGQLPRLHMRKGELACLPDQAYRTLECFRAGYEDRAPDCTDGLRVEWEDAWLHVRTSNTEPLVRIITEGESGERADGLFEQARALALRAIGQARGA